MPSGCLDLGQREGQRYALSIFVSAVQKIEVMDWGWNMVSLDKGSVIAGSHSMPVAEIEHNSEDGNRGGLLPLARKMSSIVPAEISIKSRAECGCGLPKRGKRQAVMTTEIILSPSATAAVASAFRSHLLAIVDLSYRD